MGIKNPGVEATRLFQLKHGIIFDDINTLNPPDPKYNKPSILDFKHSRKVIQYKPEAET